MLVPRNTSKQPDSSRLVATDDQPVGLNRYEIILGNAAETVPGTLAETVAEAVAAVRTRYTYETSEQRAIRDVGAGLLAPMLTAFALWLLDRAATLHIPRLYFLSRDGQVLLQATRAIRDKLGLEIELDYIYSSRQSWVTASITNIEAAQLEWAFENTQFLSVRTQLNRLNINPVDVEAALNSLQFTPTDWDRNLAPDERRRLQSALLENPGLVAKLQTSIDQARNLLFAYLHQEDMLDQPQCGLVDLGWHATTQRALRNLLEHNPEQRGRIQSLHGFYFGLRGTMPHSTAGIGLSGEGFMIDEWNPNEQHPCHDLPQLGAILEMLCSADHDTLVRLELCNDRIHPILRNETMPALENWGLPLLRETVREVIDNADLHPTTAAEALAMRPVIHELLQAFWFNPTPGEAATWSRFPLGDRMGHLDKDIRLARPFRLADALDTWRNGTIELPHGCVWYSGCRALTPAPVMFCLRCAKRLGRWRHRALDTNDTHTHKEPAQ